MIPMKSKDEAVDWITRCRNPLEADAETEIRRVEEADDFDAALMPGLREAEGRLRVQAATAEYARS
jgi:hypothetical protein